ncbi:MAG: histidine phosphatase family protein [Clostridia bacterium]|nr:histidine phosphatase family protein [Clostridia bacterium]
MCDRTKIILIRHGQSIGNLTRRFLGHTDLDLSELGYLQAKTTAEHLKNEKIDRIYSSDLKRAYNTALPHAEIRNLEIITSVNLREAYAGQWEDMLVDDIIEQWGKDFFVNQWKNNFGRHIFPGGESVEQSGNRFLSEILRIAEENTGKTVAIFAHAAVIRCFWALISNISLDNICDQVPFATNASYSICYYENGKITPFEYSNDTHLSEVGITKVSLI